MKRYSRIENKIKREIVLLKGFPCRWGKCRFCDYIEDNSDDEEMNIRVNDKVLDSVTGEFGILEVINSGNIFELPQKTLDRLKSIINEKGIHTIFFESHWMYRKKIQGMRDFFGIRSIVKTGVETFDRDYREKTLYKGFNFNSPEELLEYFDSPCLLVGMKGQSKEMIASDIKTAEKYFSHFTVNVFVENSTEVKPDKELITWFQEEYSYLEDLEKCDVLWVNTDFGVGD